MSAKSSSRRLALAAAFGLGLAALSARPAAAVPTGTVGLIPFLSSATFSSGAFDQAAAIAKSGPNLYVVGFTSSAAKGADIWVSKWSDAGLILLASTTVDGTAAGNDAATGVAIDPASGNVFVVGVASAAAGAGSSLWLGKFDPNLNLLSSATFTGIPVNDLGNGASLPFFQDQPTGILISGGNVYVSGTAGRSVQGKVLLAQFGTNLNFISSNTFNPGGNGGGGTGLAMDGLGNFYVAGCVAPPASSCNTNWVGKFNSSLVFVTSAAIAAPGGNTSINQAVQVDPTNSFVFVSGDQNTLGATGSVFVQKYDLNLTQLATRLIPGVSGGTSTGWALKITPNRLYVGGELFEGGSAENAFIGELDYNLNVLSSSTFSSGGASDREFGLAISTVDAAATLVGGVTPGAITDAWIGKFRLPTTTPPPGCGFGLDVVKAVPGPGYHSIQDAVNALTASLGQDSCVVVRDTQTYSEQVNIQGIATNGHQVRIMADPTFVSSAPVVDPPSGSTAAFVVKNASVTIYNLAIVSTNSVAFGILASSNNVTISSVSINDIVPPAIAGAKIWSAGISVTTQCVVAFASVTLRSDLSPASDGIVAGGLAPMIDHSSATGNNYGGLLLNGANWATVTNGYFTNPSGGAQGATVMGNNNTISNSTMTTAGGPSYGLWLGGNGTANNNTVTQSYIFNPGAGAAALNISAANSNTISFSTIVETGGGVSGAVNVNAAGAGNVLDHDMILNSAGYGIVLNSSNNTVSFSTVTGNDPGNATIRIVGPVVGNTIAHSYVYGGASTGVFLAQPSGQTSITFSTITSAGTGTPALYVNGSSSNTVLQSWVQAINGAATASGVTVDNYASSTTITLSTVTAVTGTGLFDQLSFNDLITSNYLQGTLAAKVANSTAVLLGGNTLFSTSGPGLVLVGNANPTISTNTISKTAGGSGPGIDLPSNIGTISITSLTVSGFTVGVKIDTQSAASLAVSSWTFTNLQAGATAINFTGGTFNIPMPFMQFDTSVYVNVNASSLTATSAITMTSASGGHTGASYADDPLTLLQWPGYVNVNMPGGCSGFNVAKSGLRDYSRIQDAVNHLPASLFNNFCVMVRDAQTYNEQVAVQGVASNNFVLKILADPTFVSSAPVISPPAASTAAFVVKNGSVTIAGITISPTSALTYGVLASSASLTINNVRIFDSVGNINTDGIAITGPGAVVSNSSVTTNAVPALFISLPLPGNSAAMVLGSTFTAATSVASNGTVMISTGGADVISGSFITNTGNGHGLAFNSGTIYNANNEVVIQTTMTSVLQAGLYNNANSSLTVTNSYMYGAYGIYLNSVATATITQSTMSNNSCVNAAAVFAAGNFITATGDVISNSGGPALSLAAGNINSVISQDTVVGGSCGAALTITGASSTITSSYISNNVSTAVFISGSNMNTITQSTITSNSSSAAALFIQNASTNTISQTKIAAGSGQAVLLQGASSNTLSGLNVSANVNNPALQITSNSSTNTVTMSRITNAFIGNSAAQIDGGSSNNTISFSTITGQQGNNCFTGAVLIQGSGTNNNTLSYDVIFDTITGGAVHFYNGPSNNLVFQSSITSIGSGACGPGAAVYMGYGSPATNNTISNCFISAGAGNGGVSFDLSANNNTVTQSTVTALGAGSQAVGMINNATGNTVTQSYLYSNGVRTFGTCACASPTISNSTIISAGAGEALLTACSGGSYSNDFIINTGSGAGAVLGGPCGGSSPNNSFISNSTITAASGTGLTIGAFSGDSVTGSYIQGNLAVVLQGSTGTYIAGNTLMASPIEGLTLTANVSPNISSNTFVRVNSGGGGPAIDLHANLGTVFITSVTVGNGFSGGYFKGISIDTQPATTNLAISSFTFKQMQPGATAVFFTNGILANPLTLQGFNFLEPNIVDNVDASQLTGSTITMTGYSGPRAGPPFANDPFGEVIWLGGSAAIVGADISLATVAANASNSPLLQLAMTGSGGAPKFGSLQVGLIGNAPVSNVIASLWKDSGSGVFSPGLSIPISSAPFGAGTPPLAFLNAGGAALGGTPTTYYVTVSFSSMSIGRQLGVTINDPSFIGLTPGFVSASTLFPIKSGLSTVQQLLFANPATQGYATPTAPNGAINASGGFDTGFAVQSGQTVLITATGTWTGPQGTTSADGTAALGGLGAGLRLNSLVGRVGSGNWFQLGTNNVFTAGGAGNLVLAMDATSYASNSGAISVSLQVQISTSPKIWTGASGVNFNASTNGNWLNSLPPAPGDAVIFDGSHNVGCNWDVYGANLGLLKLTTSYSQTVTIAPAAYQLTVATDVIVSSGALVLGSNTSLIVQGKLVVYGGVFDMGAGGSALLLGGKGVAVNNGGVFKSLGTSTVTIAAINPNIPFPFYNGNGTLNINNSQQTQIKDVASVTIGTMTNLQALSNAAFLNTSFNLYPSILLTGCATPSPCLLGGFNNDYFDINVSSNVDATAMPAGSTVPVNNASGPHFGSPFSNDPKHVVAWSPDGGAQGTITGTIANAGGGGGPVYLAISKAANAGPINVYTAGVPGGYNGLQIVLSTTAGTYTLSGLTAPNTYYVIAWRTANANGQPSSFDPEGGYGFPGIAAASALFLPAGGVVSGANVTLRNWSAVTGTINNNSSQFGPAVVQAWNGAPGVGNQVASLVLPPVPAGGSASYVLAVPAADGVTMPVNNLNVVGFVDVNNNNRQDAFEASGSSNSATAVALSTTAGVNLSIAGGGAAPGGALFVGTANPFNAHPGWIGYSGMNIGGPMPQAMMRLDLSASSAAVAWNALRVDLSQPLPGGLSLALWRNDSHAGSFANPNLNGPGPFDTQVGAGFVPPGVSSATIQLFSPEILSTGAVNTYFVAVDLMHQAIMPPFQLWVASTSYFALSQGSAAAQGVYPIQTSSATSRFLVLASAQANAPSGGGSDTGLFVAAGQSLTIGVASGTWNLTSAQPTGGAGVANSAGGATVVPGANLGQMIGRFGDFFGNGGPWFPIVASNTYSASFSGDLWLAMNDNQGAYFSHSGAVFTNFSVSGSTIGAISGTIVYVGTQTTGNLIVHADRLNPCPPIGGCLTQSFTTVATINLPLAGGTTLYNYLFAGLPTNPAGYKIDAVIQNIPSQIGNSTGTVVISTGSTVTGVNFGMFLGLGTISGSISYAGTQLVPNFGIELEATDNTGATIAIVDISTPRAGAFSIGNLPTPATYTIYAFGDVRNDLTPEGTDPYNAILGVFLDTGAALSGLNMSLFDTGEISGGLTFPNGAPPNSDFVVQVGVGQPGTASFVPEIPVVYKLTAGANPGDTFLYDVGLLTPATNYSVIAFLSPDKSDVLQPGNPVAVDNGPIAVGAVAHVLDNLTLSGNVPPPPPTGFFGQALSTDTVRWNWNTVKGAGQYLLKNALGAPIATLGPSATFYLDTGLGFNANSAVRQIVSSNTFGAGPAVFFSTVASLAAVPGQPAAAPVFQSSATLAWSANGNSAQTVYTVVRATAASGPYLPAFQTMATSGSDTGLVPSTLYFWKVKAANANGINAGAGAAASATTLAPSGPSIAGLAFYGGRQAGPIAVQVSVSTSFSPLTAGVSLPVATSYFIAVPPSANYFLRAFVDVYGDGNLHPGEDLALSGAVAVAASPVTNVNLALSSSPAAPGSPLALTFATPQGLVALNWNAPAFNANGTPLLDLAGFRVYRSTVLAGPFAAISTSTVFGTTGTVAGTSFNDLAPVPNVLNYYRVTAVDFAGNESAPSGGVAVLPFLGAQIAGQVQYFGTTTQGAFHVRLSSTPDLNGFIGDTTVSPFAFTGLADGTYFVEAFRDLVGNNKPADGDPVGNLGGLAAPYPIQILGGNSVTGSTLTVCDRGPVTFGVGVPNTYAVATSTGGCPALDQGPGFFTTLGSFRVGGGGANSVGVGAQLNIQLQSNFPNRLLLLGPGGAVVAQDATPGGARISFLANQPGLYLIEPTSFNPFDVGQATVSLSVIGGFNGTINGSVAYAGLQGGKVVVQLFNTPNPPSQGGFPIQQSTFAAPGAYSFNGLPDGVYFLRAFRDAQNDFHQDPGDPSGVFGASASSLTAVSVQGGVTFVNGVANAAANITLSDPAVGTISGQILRQGSQVGTIFVAAGLGQLNNGFQAVAFATLPAAGAYALSFVPPATGYTVVAFVDVNGNGRPDPLEAAGSTAPITAAAGQATTVNLLVSDPGSGPAGNSTLQGVVSYAGASTGPLLMGFATDSQFQNIAYLLSQSSTGTYVKNGIVGGTSYYIAAFLDANLNGEPDDKLGEPLGFFGASPANDFSSKQPVFVPNNGAAAANVTLADAPNGQISGQVTYAGSAPLSQNLIVKAYLPGGGGNSGFNSQQVVIPRAGGVFTYNYSLPFLNAAPNYTVMAFIDAIGNGNQAPGEPVGFFGQVTCNPGVGCFGAPVAVSSSAVSTASFPTYGVNVQVNDPNQAPGNFNSGAISVSVTYFGIQSGPIVVRLFSSSTYVGAPVTSQAFPVPPGPGFYSFTIPNVSAGTYYVDAFRDTSFAGIFNPAFQAYVQAGAVTVPPGQSFPVHLDAPAMADPGAGGSVNVYSGSFAAPGGARFDGGATDIAFDMTADTATPGGPFLYVSGVTDQQPTVPTLVKYSSAGVFLTSATLPSGNQTSFFFPAVDPVGGYVYLPGSNGGQGVVISTPAILQLNTSLKTLNMVQLTPADPNWGAQSAQSLKIFNGFIWVGVRSSQNGGQLLRKINPATWQTVSTGTFAFPTGAAVCSINCSGTRVNALVIDTNTASVYALITFDPGGPGNLAAIAKYDSNLNLLQIKDITGLNVPTGGKTASASMAVDQQGNLYLAFVPLRQTGPQAASTYKFNSSLQQIGYTTYSPILTHFAFSKMAIGPDNNVFETVEVPSNGGDYGVLRYDSNLNLINTRTFDGGLGLEDAPSGLAVMDSSDVFVAGTVNSGRNLDWATLLFNMNNSGSASGAGAAVVITTANALNPIFGNLSYAGALVSSGTVRAALFPLGAAAPVRFSSAPFAASVPYLFNNVPAGTYQIKSFIDLNGNFLADAGEPTGISVSTGFFVSGTTATPLNIGLCDRLPIAFGQTIAATITPSDCASSDQGGAFQKLYTFAGLRGQAVTVNAAAVNFFDVPLKLYDANGSLLASDDGSAGNGNSRLTNLLLPADGLYTIAVSPFNSGISSATFTLALGNSAGSVAAISGNISYAGAQGGRVVAAVFSTDTFTAGGAAAPVQILTLPGPGPFTFSGLASGATYFIGAFIDVSAAGRPVPGDDVGLFGSSVTGRAFPIFLRSGQNVNGINFAIVPSSSAQAAAVSGLVSYNGIQTGQLHVEFWPNSSFSGQPVAGRIVPTGAGPYDVLVPGGLPYYVRAWLDVTNTFIFAPGDPSGFYAPHNQGAETVFAPSSGSLVGVNFTITDPGQGTGGIAGEGTAVIAPSTAAAGAQIFSATITYTAGAHGLNPGGQVGFIVPPGFPPPQPGLVTTTGTVAAGTFGGVFVTPVSAFVTVQAGKSVAPGQTVVFVYTQGPVGCYASTQAFAVTESQQPGAPPQPLFAGSPSLQVVQGSPVFLQPSNPYLSLTQGALSDPQRLLTMDSCGNVAPVTQAQGPVTANLSGQRFDVNTSTFVADASIGLSTGPTFTPVNSINLTFAVGQSSAAFFAVANSTGFKNIKATFNLGQPATFFYGLTALPGNALFGVSASTMSNGTGQKTAAIQPNGSGLADFAFINFTLGDPAQSWDVMVSSIPFKAGVAPNPIWQTWGYGQPNLGQIAWDGRSSPWINAGAKVPSGNYYVRVEVAGGGVHDDSLVINVVVPQIAGRFLDSGVTPNVPLAGVAVSVFGPNGNILAGSDSGGSYVLPGVQAGLYNMTINRQDFLTGSVSLTVSTTSTGSSVSTFTVLSSAVSASTNASGGLDILLTRASVLFVAPSVVNFSTAAADIWGQIQVTPSSSAASLLSYFSPIRLPAGTTTFDDGGQWDPGLQQFIAHTIFRFGVAPGTYTVQGFLPDFSLSSATVYVGPGLNNVSLQLRPESTVSGLVSVPSNPNGTFVSVFAQSVSTATAGGGGGGVQLPAGVFSGTYTIAGLDPGLYLLQASANGLAAATTGPILVPPAANVAGVNFLTLGAGASLSGAITFSLDTTGRAGISVSVNAWAPGSQSFGSTNVFVNGGAPGTSVPYFIGGLVPGATYQLYAGINGYNGPSLPNVQVLGGQPQVSTAAPSTVNFTFFASSGSIAGTLILPAGSSDFGSVSLVGQTIASLDPSNVGHQFSVQSSTQLPGFLCTANNAPANAATGLCPVGNSSATINVQGLNTETDQITFFYATTGQSQSQTISVVNGAAATVRVDLSPVTFSISGAINNQITSSLFNTNPNIVANAPLLAPAGYPAGISSTTARVEAVLQDINSFNVAISTTFNPVSTHVGFLTAAGTFTITNVPSGVYFVRTVPLRSCATCAVVVPAVGQIVNVAGANVPVSSVTLTLTSGYSVSGAITLGGGLQDSRVFQLTVVDQRQQVVASTSVSLGDSTLGLAANSVNYAFSNLPANNFYTLSVVDAGSPAKYAGQPIKFPDPGLSPNGLQSSLSAQNVTMQRAAFIIGQMQDANTGALITANNAALLAPNFSITATANPWVLGGFAVAASSVAGRPIQANGAFSVGPLLPNVAYDVALAQRSWDPNFLAQGSQNYAPVTLSGLTPQAGQILNVGVVTLSQGQSIGGNVTTSSPTVMGLGNILVAAQPSFGNASGLVAQTYTNQSGHYSLWVSTAISTQYDITAAPRGGNVASNGVAYGQVALNHVNLLNTTTADFLLQPLIFSVTGQVLVADAAAGGVLKYPFGARKGFPAAAVFLQPQGVIPAQNPLGDIPGVTDSQGGFTIPGLSTGSYSLNVVSLGYKVFGATVAVSPSGVVIYTADNLPANFLPGNLITLQRGASITGRIVRSDGSAPNINEIGGVAAADFSARPPQYLTGTVDIDPVAKTVNSYNITGFNTSSTYTVVILPANKSDDAIVPAEGAAIRFSAQEATASKNVNLTFNAPAMLCTATSKAIGAAGSGRFKIKIGCNKPLRNQGQADNDLSQIVAVSTESSAHVNYVALTTFNVAGFSIPAPNGTGQLSGFDKSIRNDRREITAIYTAAANETSFSIALKATGNSIDAHTGANFTASQVFDFFTGIPSNVTQRVTNMSGGQVSMEASDQDQQQGVDEQSGVSIPPGCFAAGADTDPDQDASATTNVTLGMQKATAQNSASVLSLKSMGVSDTQIRTMANPAAYPAEMAAAMMKLGVLKGFETSAASTITITGANPLSSFYAIFLPAGIRHQLKQQADLKLTLTQACGANQNNINVWFYDATQGKFVMENTNRRLDCVNKTITVAVKHFSTFVVLDGQPVAKVQNPLSPDSIRVINFPNPSDCIVHPGFITNSALGAGAPVGPYPGTMIRFMLPGPTGEVHDATIRVYDLAGELVRTMTQGPLAGGFLYYTPWNCNNDSGSAVASGVYLGEVEWNKKRAFVKMAIIKGSNK